MQGSVQLVPLEAHPDGTAYAGADADIIRLFRFAIVATVVLVVGFGGSAALAPISGAVVAAGKVAVEGKRRAIQHLDGGVVTQLHARDGDVVAAGDLLVTLESLEIQEEVAGLDREIAARMSQIGLAEKELKDLLDLFEKRLVPHHRVTSLQKEAASLAGEVARLTAQRAKAKGRLGRVEIRAPIAGRIINFATHTVGGVIAPNATIGEVVPSQEGLVVEARLSPQDVDQVHPGQPARVLMTSFNQRTTPSLFGTVEQISPDLVRDEEKGREYYLARIMLAENTQQRLGSRKTLQPGMPAEVLIEAERRSILSYLTKPLRDQITRAFREE
jgi:multidrug efflux pump subunit AcrA (membrane-fusion protein)